MKKVSATFERRLNATSDISRSLYKLSQPKRHFNIEGHIVDARNMLERLEIIMMTLPGGTSVYVIGAGPQGALPDQVPLFAGNIEQPNISDILSTLGIHLT